MYKNLNNEKHLFSDTQLFNTAPSGVIKISNNFIRGASGVNSMNLQYLVILIFSFITDDF